MSGWFDSFNQAVGFTKDPAEVQQNAVNAQTASTAAAQAEYKRQYEQSRSDFAPYRNLAPQATATLESSLYGGGRGYTDANGNPQTANGQQFDLANYKPEGSAAYDWQKSRTLEDLGNYFNLTGRGRGSTVQSNTTARALGDLNASEYDKGYNRLFTQKQDYQNNLLNLVKVAQGAAGSTGTLGQAASQGIAGASLNQGNNVANAALSTGLMQQGNQQNAFNNATSLAGLGMKAYDMYSGVGNGYGQTWNDSGGDINKVDFGSFDSNDMNS